MGAITDILRLAKARRAVPSLSSAEAYFRSVARLDYGAALKKHFARSQLTQMLKEMRKALPGLNREIFRFTQIRRLSSIAADLGAVLRAGTFKDSDAAGLRGFYVDEAQVLKRPLIWVNTGAHPAAAAAAFWHEIGHHLTNRMWGIRHRSISRLFGANFGNDLSDNLRDGLADPQEISADLVRVLAGYPHSTARRLFGGCDPEVLNRDADLLVAEARPHVQRVMGIDLRRRCSPITNLHYLSGMIHIAKMRATLLFEYGI